MLEAGNLEDSSAFSACGVVNSNIAANEKNLHTFAFQIVLIICLKFRLQDRKMLGHCIGFGCDVLKIRTIQDFVDCVA